VAIAPEVAATRGLECPILSEHPRMTATSTFDAQRALTLAKQTFEIEAQALLGLAARQDDGFAAAVRAMLECRGRVIVMGMGKSGHVGRKIAATLASTGTPAFFVHPAEAHHGDLGMIAPGDVVIMISNSGETDELVALVPHLKRQGAAIVAITGNESSSLAQAADIRLDAAVDGEAGPLGVAPTASTTAALALGDALALALLDARGITLEQFRRTHPGGVIGRKLQRVSEVMRTGDAIPVTPAGAKLAEAIAEMSAKGMGMTIVIDRARHVLGIFTDGDLRRAVARGGDVAHLRVDDVMTRTPRTIGADRLAIDSIDHMETPPKVSQLVVVDDNGTLVGALHLHDLFRARVV
jgi:arabinose-5-phosphate isomerase